MKTRSDMTTAGKSFTPLIPISSFDFPIQLDEKYGIVRGNTGFDISYLKGTFMIGVWYIDPIPTPGLGFRLGTPLRFEAQDLLELIRRNPILQDYEFGLKSRAKHALFVILDGKTPNAFIAPFDMLAFLFTIPRDKIATEIRNLASSRVISAESSKQFKPSEKTGPLRVLSKVQETKRKFNDKAEDLLRSNGHTIENSINLFLGFCESDEIMKGVTRPLEQNANVEVAKWYDGFSKSAASMSGSEKFMLPTDDDDRLALLYQPLLKIRSTEISYHSLSFGARNINVAASRFNDAISRPLIRGLSYKIEVKEQEETSEKPVLERASRISSNRVFVVHGHDETLKNELEIFLTENGLEAVVLHRKPDRGLTIIEKLEQNSDVSYAFVLLTPDDIGYPKEDDAREDSVHVKELRARQNVIFELGYFVGRLGRNKVCCIYKSGVTLPTDFRGVLYKQVSTNIDLIAYDLLKELRAAGLTLSLSQGNALRKTEVGKGSFQYQASQLTKPLQDIYGNLEFGRKLSVEAVNIFKREIEHRGLLDILTGDSPELAENINRLVALVEQIRTKPYTADEARELLGDEHYKSQSQFGDDYVAGDVLRERLANSDEAGKLIDRIKEGIRRLLAKYAGFDSEKPSG